MPGRSARALSPAADRRRRARTAPANNCAASASAKCMTGQPITPARRNFLGWDMMPKDRTGRIAPPIARNSADCEIVCLSGMAPSWPYPEAHRQSLAVAASVPILKFARSLYRPLGEFQNCEDTSKLLSLVSFWFRSSLWKPDIETERTSKPRH